MHYSPVRIINPTSLSHLVRLKPAQNIRIVLDKKSFPNTNITFSTTNLRLQEIIEDGRNTTFEVVQDEKVHEWSDYSTSLLGDIWIDSDNVESRLIVMLEAKSKDKEKFTTIINPDCADIPIKAGDLMEIILFNHDFGEQDEWVWTWKPLQRLSVQLLGCDHLFLNGWRNFYREGDKDQPNCHYARFPRGSSNFAWCRQHHFWFRFDHSLLALLDKESGKKLVGQFKFEGWPNRFTKHKDKPTEYHLSVFVDLNPKYRNNVIQSLTLTEKEGYIIPSSVQPFHPCINSPIKRDRIYYIPKVRNIDVQLINFTSIEDGCREVPCMVKELPKDDDFLIGNNYVKNHFPCGTQRQYPPRFYDQFEIID